MYTNYYHNEIESKVIDRLTNYHKYFNLSEQDIARFALLADDGSEMPEEQAVEQIARLTSATDEMDE